MSKKPTFPIVEIAPRGPRSGGVLPIPKDFTQVVPETVKTCEARLRSRALLKDEAAHLKSIGMTWEELQRYQDILSDNMNVVPQAKPTLK
jgi:hypothetical protein